MINRLDGKRNKDVLEKARPSAGSRAPHSASDSVLFAGGSEMFDTRSLMYAQTIAGMSDARLLVLRVTSAHRSQNEALPTGLRSGGELADATDDLSHLPPALLPVEYLMRQGGFPGAVVRACSEFPPSLVVITPDSGHTGGSIARIAGSARVPVLAPRHVSGQATHRTVLAGVDLRCPALPVLRAAAAFAVRFAASLVVVHNLAPVTVRMKGDWRRERSIARSPDKVIRALERLRESVQEVATTAESIVTTDIDSARALLRVADGKRADLIVVGVRDRSSTRMSIGGHVPERVTNHAHQSVLTIPVI